MDGKTIFITGSTDGHGRYVAVRLAEAGADLILHGRDRQRADKVRAEVRAASGHDPEVILADLADLHEVDRLADEVLKRGDRLDAFVSNAGIATAPRGRGLSKDGVELRFAVNHLAGYHLARRLTPRLTASAPARVVNVASAGQQAIDFTDPMLERGYSGMRAYAQSKLAQIMFTVDLAEELRDAGVLVNALHPATFMNTRMVRRAGVPPISTVRKGGNATLRLIADPEVTVSGRYFDGMREATPNTQAADPEARRRLRELSDRLIAEALG
ncbi:MAG: SDR family NAD(P)-dependent oxidoreductase [Streptosporangiales bacterium]|nr:SDR family NAD(P)-dependent oxidoreductase [Streptosporangiales bacterium]